MSYNSKKVSVIIPVYGAERFIAKTVESVINQTHQNIEILIIDDETRDSSIEICKQFTDKRIKIISQKNRGLAGARNTGIRNAQGDYLAFIDADDLWRPDKLAKHVAYLDTNRSVGVSFSRSLFIDENDNPLGIYQMSKLTNITPLDFWCRSPIGNGSAGVFRRQVFEDIKFQDNLYGKIEDFYFDDRFRESEDVECWLRVSIQTNWEIEGIAEDLTLYRVNSQGLSADINKMMESWYKLIEKVRSYAPTQMDEWEKPAIAYRLRYLARRAVTLQAGWTSVGLLHRALAIYWQILIEEPRRTFITGAAAYLLCILPKSLYSQIQKLALSITGANQKNRIQQEVHDKNILGLEIPTMNKFDEISLLGTKFHKLKVNELINYVISSAQKDKKTIVGNVNVRAINFAYELPWYRNFINKSDVVFCDGFGVLLGAKMCGHCIDSSHRMTCPDYIENLAKACEDANVSLFLLAGKPGVADKAVKKLQVIAPNLKIESHHGYFDKSGKENELVIERINQFKPDVLYVGFGMPVQERWILSNSARIDAKVFLPLGACLDFYTGAVYRGPRWMTNRGLEWLTRFFTEPQRLWERYVVGNPLFFYRVIREKFIGLTQSPPF